MQTIFKRRKYNDTKPKPNTGAGVRHGQFVLLFLTLLFFYGEHSLLSVSISAMTKETPPHPNIPTYPDWANSDKIMPSFLWGYMVPQIIAGQLSEYYGPRWFLCGIMITESIINTLVPTIAEAFGCTGVTICCIIHGFCQGFFYPCIHNIISKWAPRNERTTITGVVYAGSYLGNVVSMIFTGAIAGTKYGWTTVFYFCGVWGLVWTVIFVTFISNSSGQHPDIWVGERVYIESTNSICNHTIRKEPTPWIAIAKSLPFWALLVTNCGQYWVMRAVVMEIPTFLDNILRYNIEEDSDLSAVPYFAMFIVCLIGGPIVDQLVSKQILSISTSRKVFNLLGSLVPTVALFSLGLVNTADKDTTMVLLTLAVGTTAISSMITLVNLIDLAPNHAGTLLGISSSISTIFGILGPYTVKLLGTDKKDPLLWRNVFWLGAAIYLSTSIFYIIFSSGKVQTWNCKECKNESQDVERPITL